MPVRKTVFRASAVALFPMILSGCGIPLGVQVASWAADGISMLTTEKSVSDHGISAVTQKDCAIWRVFKGESICKETAANIELAAAEKLDDEDDNFEHIDSQSTSIQVASLEAIPLPAATKSANAAVQEDPLDDEDDNFTHIVKPTNLELAIIEMEAHKLATMNTAAGADDQSIQQAAAMKPTPLPGIKTTYKNAQVSQGHSQQSIIVADAKGGSGLIARPLPPPVPVKIESVNRSTMKTRLKKRPMKQHVRSKPVTTEQPVNHEPIAIPETQQPVTSQKPKRTLRKPDVQKPIIEKRRIIKRTPVKRSRIIAGKKATPGLYYVLGSFSVQKNANRMARRANGLSPKIVVAYPKGKRVHRVLVGPFAKSQQTKIRSKIRAANIRGFWILRMKTARKTKRLPAEQLAELPR